MTTQHDQGLVEAVAWKLCARQYTRVAEERGETIEPDILAIVVESQMKSRRIWSDWLDNATAALDAIHGRGMVVVPREIIETICRGRVEGWYEEDDRWEPIDQWVRAGLAARLAARPGAIPE